MDEVTRAEHEFVTRSFDDLKALVARLGPAEMKVSVDVDRETGNAQIIWCGFTFKRSVEPMRRVYSARNGAGSAAPADTRRETAAVVGR